MNYQLGFNSCGVRNGRCCIKLNISSTADLINIATGNDNEVGEINPLNSLGTFVGGKAGKGAESFLNDMIGKKAFYLEEKGKFVGTIVSEGIDFGAGVAEVRKGVRVIADTSYRFKEISSIGNKIIPSDNVAVNNVSSAEKIVTAGDITNTVVGWYDKVNEYFNKNKK